MQTVIKMIGNADVFEKRELDKKIASKKEQLRKLEEQLMTTGHTMPPRYHQEVTRQIVQLRRDLGVQPRKVKPHKFKESGAPQAKAKKPPAKLPNPPSTQPWPVTRAGINSLIHNYRAYMRSPVNKR